MVTYTANGSNYAFYVDGDLKASGALTGALNVDSSLFFGGRTSGGSLWHGILDEVIVLNVGLNRSEVQTLYESQNKNYSELSADWTPHWDEIVGYWKMDGNWLDSSGNKNHGTAGNDASFTSDAIVGNQAGTFDGTNDYVDVGSLDFENTSEQTILTWFKIHTLGEDHKLFSAHVTTDDALEISIGNDNKIDGRTDVSGSWVSLSIEASETIEQDKWYHAGFTVNGNELALYLNGKKVATKSISSNSSLGILPARIGHARPGWMTNHDSHATIDDTAVWKKQLSETDILLIYNRQKQKYAASFKSPVIDLGSSQY